MHLDEAKSLFALSRKSHSIFYRIFNNLQVRVTLKVMPYFLALLPKTKKKIERKSLNKLLKVTHRQVHKGQVLPYTRNQVYLRYSRNKIMCVFFRGGVILWVFVVLFCLGGYFGFYLNMFLLSKIYYQVQNWDYYRLRVFFTIAVFILIK